MLIERPITAEQMTDVGNALAVVQGKGIPSSSTCPRSR